MQADENINTNVSNKIIESSPPKGIINDKQITNEDNKPTSGSRPAAQIATPPTLKKSIVTIQDRIESQKSIYKTVLAKSFIPKSGFEKKFFNEQLNQLFYRQNNKISVQMLVKSYQIREVLLNSLLRDFEGDENFEISNFCNLFELEVKKLGFVTNLIK